MMSHVISQVKNLSKQYPSFSLKDVSFALKEGVITGFIGRNGAGKTTTLKCIYNLVTPNSGSIVYDGREFTDIEEEAKNDIGLLFGGVDYYPNQKVKTIAQVTSRFYRKWDETLFEKWLKFFDIDQEKKIKNLSNGMKVKFGLAMALSHNAKVLLLDEPTSGLDPVSRDEILDCFLKIAELKKVAILFSTHVISDLDRCADEIVYIKQGEIYFSGVVADFAKSYLHIEGLARSLSESDKAYIGHLVIHAGKFVGIIPQEEKDRFSSYQLSKPNLEEIMLYIERGHEDEESPF